MYERKPCARRAEFLISELDPSQQTVLFLGDNDITSIAFAIASQGLNVPHRIIVIDLDDNVLDMISRVAQQNNLEILIFKQDLRLAFSEAIQAFAGTIDVIFTDPPYTIPGMELFLHRGLELLNPDTGVIYACFGYSVQDLVIGMKFQQLLSDLKLVVRTQLENFNTYLEAGSIGSTSHLYKLRPARRIKLVPDFHSSGPIYTGYSESEEIKLYENQRILRFRISIEK